MARSLKILLTGISGQVGRELSELIPGSGLDVELVGVDRSEFDLAAPDNMVSVIREVKPGLIINPAAYTAVDKAETDAQSALSINGYAPGLIAEQAREIGALLIHYSTDYVFDGKATVPYPEDAKTNPLGIYGASKLAGEKSIAEVDGDYLILRTSWVYGTRGKNFLLTMLRLAGERDELRVVDDQHGTPNWSRSLASGTVDLIRKGCGPLSDRKGIYNLTSLGATTWYGFATSILAGRDRPRLLPIPTAEYPTPAPRPGYSVLDPRKLRSTFGLELHHWEEDLDACLRAHSSINGA